MGIESQAAKYPRLCERNLTIFCPRKPARQSGGDAEALGSFVPPFKFHLRITARRGGGYGRGYFFEMQFYDRPLRRAEDDKGEAPVGEVLL
jgi:hypothetical protein